MISKKWEEDNLGLYFVYFLFGIAGRNMEHTYNGKSILWSFRSV